MEVAIQGIPKSIKPPYTNRLRQAKADLTKYKKLSKDIHSQTARTNLLGGFKKTSSSDDPYGEGSDRARLLAGTETLNDGSRRIADSTSVALETETYGADVLRSLRGQRDQLENSRNMVMAILVSLSSIAYGLNQLQEADTHVDRASGTLKGMIRQYVCRRIAALNVLTLPSECTNSALSLVLLVYFLLFSSSRFCTSSLSDDAQDRSRTCKLCVVYFF